MSDRSAVMRAIEGYRYPARLRGSWHDGFPQDVLRVIKIASGDEETTKACSEEYKVDEEQLTQAAGFYLSQMFQNAAGNRHALLGLGTNATLNDVRTHRRFLLKWLHPDRTGSAWHSIYFKSIQEASKDLEAEISLGVVSTVKNSKIKSAYSSTPSQVSSPHALRRRKLELGTFSGSVDLPRRGFTELLHSHPKAMVFALIIIMNLLLLQLLISNPLDFSSNWFESAKSFVSEHVGG